MKTAIIRVYRKLIYMVHVFRVLWKICFGRIPFSRNQLLGTYMRLLSRQRTRSGMRDHKPIVPGSPITVMQYEVEYQDIIQLVRLFEEIFVYEAYRFDPRNPDPVVIDCGSNIGIAILYFKTVQGGSSILAFEPHKETFEMLKRNVTRNGINNVDLFNAALANRSGGGLLHSNPHHTLNMTLKPDFGSFDKTEIQAVNVARLSDHVPGTVDLVKIDVEGSEEDIVDELIESGKISAIRQIAVEYHTWYQQGSIVPFIQKMERAGFQLRRKETNRRSNEVILHFVTA